MRTPFGAVAALAFLFFVPVLQAEDWTTTDGKTYRGVTVLGHDKDNVTILDKDGGASIPLANLPPNLQKKFNFDAKAAAALKAQQDAKAAADLKAQQEAKAAADAIKAKEESDARQQQEAADQKAKADFDASEKANITGRVFTVTKEKETINLGQINISLLSEDEMNNAMAVLTAKAEAAEKKLKPTLDAENANCQKLKSDLDAISKSPRAKDAAKKLSDALDQYKATLVTYYGYRSQAYYMAGTPTPVVKAVSDADGNFTIQIPKTGSWVLEGEGQRSVGDKTKHYFWLAKLSKEAIAKNQVALNDDNFFGVSSEDAMISALDQPTIDEIVGDKVAAITKK